MSKRVVYTPSAVQDLEEILEYISQDDPAAATRIAAEIRETVGSLSEYPFMGRRFGDQGFGEHRARVINNYLALYIVNEDEVQIRRIVHGSRRFVPLLD